MYAHVSDLAEISKLQERWAAGVWFGKTFETDSHIVLTEQGIVTARTCKESLECEESLRSMLLKVPVPPTGRMRYDHQQDLQERYPYSGSDSQRGHRRKQELGTGEADESRNFAVTMVLLQAALLVQRRFQACILLNAKDAK